jgi:hypothetical protein
MPKIKIKDVLATVSVGCLATMTLTPAATATDAQDGFDAVAKRAQLLGAPCGSAAPADRDPDTRMYTNERASMRTGSGPSCRRVAWIEPDFRLDPACRTFAHSNGHWWSYMQSYSPSGIDGWIRNDHLQGGGADPICNEYDIARPAFVR